MITQIRHVGVVVNDLEKSLEFYKDLGLQVRIEMEEDGPFIDTVLGLEKVRVQTVKLKTVQGGGVELLYYHSPQSPARAPCAIHQRGITHMALTIEGLDETYARLTKKGIQFICAPQAAPGGHAKVAFCQDPEGNYIELIEELRVLKPS